MIGKITSLVDEYWVPDPEKIAAAGWMSVVVADRAGPDDIEKVLSAAGIPDANWIHSTQEGNEITSKEISGLVKNFSDVGKNYYLNQYIEISNKIIFWLPEFSEYSVLIFNAELRRKLNDVLAEIGRSLDDWIEGDFWTENERQFIQKGRSKYTILPIA